MANRVIPVLGTDSAGKKRSYLNLRVFDNADGTYSLAVSTAAGAAGPVSEADGANVVLGALADAAIQTSVAGTINAKLRGIVAWLALAFDAVSNAIGVTSPAPLNYASAAAEASHAVKATAGTLFGVTIYNSGPAQYINLWNLAAVPANTTVPSFPPIKVAADSTTAISWGIKGRAMSTGISINNSTTAATKTLGAADCWFDVQYI